MYKSNSSTGAPKYIETYSNPFEFDVRPVIFFVNDKINII